MMRGPDPSPLPAYLAQAAFASGAASLAGSPHSCRKGFMRRSLLIVILPMVILQTVVTYVFLERHWQLVTHQLSTALVQDIAAIIDIHHSYPQDKNYETLTRIAQQRMNLDIEFMPKGPLPPPLPKPFFSIVDSALSKEISRQIEQAFLARHGRPLEPHRNPHSARQFDPARRRLSQRRLCVEFLHFPAVDARHLAGADRRRHGFLRNQIKPILRLDERRRSLRHGPRGGFSPARRARGSPAPAMPSSK